MTGTENNYTKLIQKLDQFIRKYYINQIIRGLLYFVGLAFVLFLLFNLLEHFFYFSKGVRKVMYYGFPIISGISLFAWVIYPAMKYFNLGQTISHEQAAQIIGVHFKDVQDRLLNILQLKKQSTQVENSDLIEASINQKSESIKLVPFKNAIDLSKNKKYLKYALPPFLLFLVLLFAAPSLIKDSTLRIINNDKEYERAAPFSFDIQEREIDIIQYEDFDFEIETTGNTLPEELFIDIDNYQYRMKKLAPNKFGYTFKNLQKTTPFHVFSGNVQSLPITLNVLEKPNLLNFSLYLDYPAYTGSKDETLPNIGDVYVPAGTTIRWDFESANTNKIDMLFGESLIKIDQKSDDLFSYTRKIRKDVNYKVFLSNEYIPNADSLNYQLSVIPDQHPTISVEQFVDSLETSLVYFVGEASDDYGITNLTFHYTVIDEDGVSKPSVTEKINKSTNKKQNYDYILDIQKIKLQPGEQLSYYFQVTDNDQVNGLKSSKTSVMNFKKPSAKDLKEEAKENNKEIKKELEEALKESKEIQEELQKLRDKLRQKKELDFQSKKELEKLLERQKELQEKLKNAQQNFQEKQKNEQLMNKSEETKEKDKQMEKMFEELMNDKAQELMEKIKELMDELQKDEALEMMEQMENKDETLEKELERLKELYKQLELEKEVEQLANELEELAKDEEKLADETEHKDKSNEELKKEQEKLNEKFDELKEDMKDIEKKNEELEKPKDLGDENQEDMDDIDQDMDDAQEELEKQENNKASKAQKSAGEKMKKMASKLQASMEGSAQEQELEDMKMIRQLLENLVTLSFDQEELVETIQSINKHTPRYIELVQEQFKIKDDFGLVADTLQELAKRQPKIETFVIEKMTEVKQNLETSLTHLEERKKNIANENQRKAMTGLNDLALMLNESLNQMQQQMAGKMPGSQMCNKPGGKGQGKPGNVPSDKITEGQEGLNKDLKEMMEKMKAGGKKPGKEGKDGKDGMSADFAKAAAKQAALRKAIEQLKKEKTEQGKGAGGLQEIIDQMDKIETDLVNKRLNSEMLARQKDILTRLLEAETADRQREMDEKRKAEITEDKVREFPPSLEKYIKEREAEINQYKTVSPALKPYYKHLVEQYYQSLKSVN